MIINRLCSLHCQSTDINGLPTSIDIVIAKHNDYQELGKFYVEIDWSDTDVVSSEIANKLFTPRDGAKVLKPEFAIYELYQFLASQGDIVGGVFQLLIHGLHSKTVLDNFIRYTKYEQYLNDTFNAIVVDTMSLAYIINSYVNKATPDGTFVYLSVHSDTPQVSYGAVMNAENIDKNTPRASANLLIYKSIMNTLIDDFKSIYNIREAPKKCPSCGANTYNGNDCFICGFKRK